MLKEKNIDNMKKCMKRIHIIFESKANMLTGKYSVTNNQMHMLFYLLKNQDKQINQRDIEKEFELTNPTVTGILNRLENNGFIKRSVNKNDARYKNIVLTQKTIDIEKELEKHKIQMEEKIFKDLTEEEIETISILLEKILKNLEEEQA